MCFRVEVIDSYKNLPLEWNELLAADHPMHSNQLCITEKAQIHHLSNYYTITYQDDTPVLFAYFQKLLVTPEHFNCRDKLFQHHSLNISLRIVKPTLLIAGNLFRHDALYFKSFDESITQKTYDYTCNHMLDYTKCTGIFIKDIPTALAGYFMEKNQLLKMPDDISMYLPIPPHWTSIDDYAKSLKRKYAQRFRKIMSTRNSLNIEELDLAQVIENASTIEKLYLQVTNHQLVSMGKLNAAFFVEMKKSMPEHYKLYAWYLDGKMVAFSSAIVHDGEFDMNYIGFDYQINQSHQLYFHILFHCLEEAIRYQVKKLILGRTALEAKAIMGCEPDYKHSFYQLRHPLVQWFFKQISARFQQQLGDAWKIRKPFRHQAEPQHLFQSIQHAIE